MGTRSRVDTSPVAQGCPRGLKLRVQYESHTQYIHMHGIDGYAPIAVSLFRTYYEIVCSTIYLAENKSELEDFPIRAVDVL